MKRLVIGILAHVDSGKTTLSEAMLYTAGALRKLGRVDHKDAFLDTDALERARGITIFSKQAILKLAGAELTLLDTPGHVDFSAEAERALQVMDYAILVISGTDGVQSHTETLWRLLERYGVPVFIFVNKLDLAGADRAERMDELRRRFGSGCVDLSAPDSLDDLALCNEDLLETVTGGEAPTDAQLAQAVARRELFPCFFGAALKLEGVDALLEALERYTRQPEASREFGARIFKVTRAEGGERLTWLKVTGGELKVKAELESRPDARRAWKGKADQLRLYSGAKYNLINSAPPGTVCAVTGLADSYAGEGLGFEPDAASPSLEPVLRYRVILPTGCDTALAMRQLRELEQEDPMLRVVWDERLGEAQLQLMGEVQLEVLESLIERRFGLKVSFDEGGILYQEKISARVEGVGHYEPLRHYAEVHLLLEPGEPGRGVQLATACREDDLAANWQRLILTHLAEKTHLGTLTGSPLTDVKITLAAGRAHPKHTEGGDFRQATYRAVRQGLRTAQERGECVLLEPWYDFTLRLPQESVGRALADMPRLSAEFEAPVTSGEETLIKGRAPVASLRGYAREVAAYTRGHGQLVCLPGGYELPQRGGGHRRRGLRCRSRHGEHGGLGVLQPRGGRACALGRGALAYAPAQRPRQGRAAEPPRTGGRVRRLPCRTGGGLPQRAGRGQGADGDIRTHLRPHPPRPGQRHAHGEKARAVGDALAAPRGEAAARRAGTPAGRRLQRDFRLGRAERAGGGQSGRREGAAHGHTLQLRRV